MRGGNPSIHNCCGNAAAEYTYDAWGNPLSITGTLASTIGQLNPFRYRGYVWDSETGLFYVNSRYYNPETSRYINADSQLNTSQGLLGTNMFAYCLNNPVNRVDSNGRESIPINPNVLEELIAAVASIGTITVTLPTWALVAICTASGIEQIAQQTRLMDQCTKEVKDYVNSQTALKLQHKRGTHSVYVIRDFAGDVWYVGRTSNFSVRQKQHQVWSGAKYPTTLYNMQIVATGLTLKQAKTLEQSLICVYTLEALNNVINSVSVSKWGKYNVTNEIARLASLGNALTKTKIK